MPTTPRRVMELLEQEIPRRISLNQFCKKTGINSNSVDKYLAGIAEPNLTSLRKLAAYFKVSVAYLIEESILDASDSDSLNDKVLLIFEGIFELAIQSVGSPDDFFTGQAVLLADKIVTMPDNNTFNPEHFEKAKKLARKVLKVYAVKPTSSD